VNYGLAPTWKGLLEGLGKAFTDHDHAKQLPRDIRWFSEDDHFSVYEKASLAKFLLGRHYLPTLRGLLYRDGVAKELLSLAKEERKDSLLRAVADLCQHSLVKAVVTYNYDNLLEILLYLIHKKHRRRKLGYSVFGKVPPAPPHGSLPVYHVHGFLPLTRRLPEDDKARIVLAEEDYYDCAADLLSWQTTTQLHLLQNHTCIWIGTSLKDLNMRRLSHHAKIQGGVRCSFALMCGKDMLLPEEDADKHRRLYATLLKTLGIRLIYSGNDYEANARTTRSLVEYLAQADMDGGSKPGFDSR